MEIFMFFFQRNSCLLLLNHFLSSSSFSVIHVRIDIKNYVDKVSTFFIFFLSKCPGSNAISHQKHLELLLVSYLLIELFNIGMPVTRAEGRTTGRTVTWLPKFLGWKDYQIFLGIGLRSREELDVPCPYEVIGTSYVADSRSPSTLETQEIWMHDWVPVKVEKNRGFS